MLDLLDKCVEFGAEISASSAQYLNLVQKLQRLVSRERRSRGETTSKPE